MCKSVRVGLFALVASVASNICLADVSCTGTINGLYKNTDMDGMAIQLIYADGSKSSYASLPSKSDEAMALLAFGTGKAVTLNWVDAEDVVGCAANAWFSGRGFSGIFLVKN